MRYFLIICGIVFFIVFLMFLPLLISDWKYRHKKEKQQEQTDDRKITVVSLSGNKLEHIINYYDVDFSFHEMDFLLATRDVLLEILKCETPRDLKKIKDNLTDSFYVTMADAPDLYYFDSRLTVLDSSVVGWYQDHGCDVIVAEYVVRILGESTRNKYEISMARPTRPAKKLDTDEIPQGKWEVLDVRVFETY